MHANLHTRNRDWSCTDGQQATRRWCFHQGDPHGGGGGDHDKDDYRGHLQEDEDAFRTFAVYCGLALHHAKLYDALCSFQKTSCKASYQALQRLREPH